MISVGTDSNFQEIVLNSEKPVLVDFWASWCGPCRMSEPIIDRIAEKYEGKLDVVKVDVDTNPAVTQGLNVMSLPTFALFRAGRQPIGIAGFRPQDQLEQQLGLLELAG